MAEPHLTIGDVAEQTAVPAQTLRAWERRFDFPRPARLPGGHRRYSDREVDLIRQVERDRAAGLSLAAAIARARSPSEAEERSIFSALRRRWPGLPTQRLPKGTLVAMSHAIEDECGARADHAVLIGAFQRERFYRHAEPRWRDLARSSDLCCVFADFDEYRRLADGPIEIPIPRSGPMLREWALVLESPGCSVCLVAWELPGQDGPDDVDRLYDSHWTIDPAVVREAARAACALAERTAPEVARSVESRLADPAARREDDLTVLSALTNRMVGYVGQLPPNRRS